MKRNVFTTVLFFLIVIVVVFYLARIEFLAYHNIYILILFIVSYPIIILLISKWFVLTILKKNKKTYFLFQLIGLNFLIIFYAVLSYKIVDPQLLMIVIPAYLISTIFDYIKRIKNIDENIL